MYSLPFLNKNTAKLTWPGVCPKLIASNLFSWLFSVIEICQFEDTYMTIWFY